MSALSNKLWMRKIRADELDALAALAQDDQHEPIAPSHVFLKGNEIVGYASIAQVPLILPWFHTTRCRAADSQYFINQMENLIAECMPANGQELICVPVVAGSPFQPHIADFGYVDAGKVSLAFKKVR
jgi:hypothetical protein